MSTNLESARKLKYTIWGSVLSPFLLKVRAMCDFAGVDYRWLPANGSVIEGLKFNLRVQRLKAGRLPLTYPPRDALDEYPLVPFVFGDDGSNLYDSTAIAQWLDDHHGTDSRRLIPRHPVCELVARLVDDHFDEFGLYVAHHHRWVTSRPSIRAIARPRRERAPRATVSVRQPVHLSRR